MKLKPSSCNAFDRFWKAYPRHAARLDALKAWTKLNPSPDLVERILTALAWQVTQHDWTKDDGAFVPLPATYIRGERWTDERRKSERRQPTAEVEDWYDECQRMHGGACGLSQMAHHTRKLIERAKGEGV